MEQNIHVRPADAALAPVLGRIMAASFRAAFSDFITAQTMLRTVFDHTAPMTPLRWRP